MRSWRAANGAFTDQNLATFESGLFAAEVVLARIMEQRVEEQLRAVVGCDDELESGWELRHSCPSSKTLLAYDDQSETDAGRMRWNTDTMAIWWTSNRMNRRLCLKAVAVRNCTLSVATPCGEYEL